MGLFAITMEADDEIYYAYEYTSSGRKVFDATPSLSGAKFWKSDAGAEKALRKLKIEQRYLCDKYSSIAVSPVEEEDVEQATASHADDKINRNLEYLARFQDRDVESAYKYRKALLLSRSTIGDSVRIYEKGELCLAPTVITIDAVDGIEFVIGERKFDRISGQEIGGQGRLLPNDVEICRYFALYQVVKRVRWEDQSLNVLAKVVEALGVDVDG